MSDNLPIRIPAGGLANLVEDTSPQLGGDLDCNSQGITGIAKLGIASWTQETISGGVISGDQTFCSVEGQGGAADELDTITHVAGVDIVFIRQHDDAHNITVKHNTGNIFLKGGSDLSLEDREECVMLLWNSDDSKWMDIGAGGGGSVGITIVATTIYADAGGDDDTGDGSSGSPYATVGKAVEHFRVNYPYIAHDCVIAIGAGTYTLTEAIDLAGLMIPGSLTFVARDTSDNDLYDRGTATSGGDDTLTDSGASWDTDEWNGGWVAIIAGTGAGQIRSISDTTSTQITVGSNWTTNPDATSVYLICMAKIDGNSAATYAIQSSLIHNVRIEGLYLAGATTYQIFNEFGFNCGCTACIIDGASSASGIYQAGGGQRLLGVLIRGDSRGIYSLYQAYMSMAGGTTDNVCFVAGGGEGNGTGLEANYSSAIYLSSGNCTFVDWNKGIYAHNNSVVGNGTGHTFTNCNTDYDPAVSSDAAFIET